MSEFLAISFLIVIIVVQIIERTLMADQVKQERGRLLEELSKAQKAIISKNVNEYMAAVQTDKKADKPVQNIENDEILLSEADDKTFDSFIKAQTS